MKICGEIIKIHGKTAYIKTSRPASCEGCANAGICNKKELEIQASNNIGANVGDIVDVEMPEDRKAILLLCYIFLVPVFILLLCIWLYTQQALLAAAALPLTAVYIFILKTFNKRHKTANYIVSLHTFSQLPQ